MTTAQALRSCRKERGLTQAQLARLSGVSHGAISGYENGTTIPKRRMVEKLARALDVPPEKLLPAPAPLLPSAGRSGPAPSDGLLYDGVLRVLKETYGVVEGRIIQGEGGAYRRYYVVRRVPESFILYDSDIAAIVRSAKATMTPLVEYMKKPPEARP